MTSNQQEEMGKRLLRTLPPGGMMSRYSLADFKEFNSHKIKSKGREGCADNPCPSDRTQSLARLGEVKIHCRVKQDETSGQFPIVQSCAIEIDILLDHVEPRKRKG